MYCPSCGMEIDDNSKFCPTCGERLTDALNDMGIRYKNGDESAFQEIYEDTEGWVRSYVYNRVSANNVEDCMQQIYIKLYQNIQGFDYTKGQFRPWFNTLVKNETIDFLRRFEKPQIKDVDSLYDEEDKVIDIVDPGMSPEDVMEKNEIARIMSEILSEISEEQRQCIMLRYMEGLKNKEIAEIYGISEGTVKSRISYGLKRVEAKVIELEKQGTKLYGMAPLPFFAWLICYGNVAGLFITSNVWTGVVAATGTGMGVAASGAMSGAVGSATTGGVSGAVGSAATTNGAVGMATTGEVATGTAIAPGAATVTGTTTVAGGAATTTTAGVTATAVATTGIKATILKVVLGTAIGTAVIGGGIGVKKLIDNKKQETTEITTEEVATEEIATVTDAEEATPTDVVEAEYPEWVDAYMNRFMEFSETGTQYKYIALHDMDSNGIPELELSTGDNMSQSGAGFGVYDYVDGEVIDTEYDIDLRFINNNIISNGVYTDPITGQSVLVQFEQNIGMKDEPYFVYFSHKEGYKVVNDFALSFCTDENRNLYVKKIGPDQDGYINVEQGIMTYEEAKVYLEPFFDNINYEIDMNAEYGYHKFTYEVKKEGIHAPYKIALDYSSGEPDYESVKQQMIDYYKNHPKEELQTEANVNSDWMDAYIETIKNETAEEMHGVIGIEMLDIDGNGVPEMNLLSDSGIGNGNHGAYLYYDGKVTYFENANLSWVSRMYYDGNGTMIVENKRQAVDVPMLFNIYKLKDDELLCELGVSLQVNYETGEEKYQILEYIDETQVEGRDISRAEAMQLLSEYININTFEIVESDGAYSKSYYLVMDYTEKEGFLLPDHIYDIGYEFYGDNIDYEDIRKALQEYHNKFDEN